MLVSTKGRYALRVMIELADTDIRQEYVPLANITRDEQISEKYMESIIAKLVKAGLVEGMRGKKGGYRLCRPREEYSVGEILRVAEGSIAPVSCLDCKSEKCERADTCKTLPIWEKLDSIICEYLDNVTLADFS